VNSNVRDVNKDTKAQRNLNKIHRWQTFI